MAKQKIDYLEILLRKRVISPAQVTEAKRLAADDKLALPEALIRGQFATGEQVYRALAEQHGIAYVNLSEVKIPRSVIASAWTRVPSGRPSAERDQRAPRSREK